MQMLIRLEAGRFVQAADDFTTLAPDVDPPAQGGVIVPFARWAEVGERLLNEGRKVGVRLTSADPVEALVPLLDRLSMVAVEFPIFRDGRGYSAAVLLRTRLGYRGELRAVGDVLVDQAWNLVRCGFDAFETKVSADQFAASAHRFRHVYQASADDRPPAFVERETV
jgi:uncharacterized protein (DUF934 family)